MNKPSRVDHGKKIPSRCDYGKSWAFLPVILRLSFSGHRGKHWRTPPFIEIKSRDPVSSESEGTHYGLAEDPRSRLNGVNNGILYLLFLELQVVRKIIFKKHL